LYPSTLTRENQSIILRKRNSFSSPPPLGQSGVQDRDRFGREREREGGRQVIDYSNGRKAAGSFYVLMGYVGWGGGKTGCKLSRWSERIE
jgi:hypothetical protein